MSNEMNHLVLLIREYSNISENEIKKLEEHEIRQLAQRIESKNKTINSDSSKLHNISKTDIER